jgi:DNA polymerase
VQIVTIDFETFYDTGYGLNRLTTEEYIQDLRFQVIGVAIKINDKSIEWFSGEEQASKGLGQIDWENTMLLCHNTQFDGAILKWRFNIEPKVYLDTLSMARALHGVDAGGSLKALAERYKLGEKGSEVLDAKGKRLEDFQEYELREYGAYCRNDVKLTYDLFKRLSKNFPMAELKLIDLTLRMFIIPALKLDSPMLEVRLKEVQQEKQKLLQGLMKKLHVDSEEEVRKKLASNPQFAELLKEFKVEPPMKESLTTGKQTLAFAKGDEDFQKLCEHENPFIQELCAVRLGTKSTIEETRIERFIGIANRNNGYLPIPLKYYGAHTGRWAGADKVNFQNLPSRDAKKKALKQAIVAPEGHVVINADSAQIEARILVWLAGQHDVLEQFRNNEDVYVNFARRVYKTSNISKTQRAVGKTCILGLGYGTGLTKLQSVLKINAGIEVDSEQAQNLVNLYRQVNHEVVKLWEDCDRSLSDMASWPSDKAAYYLDKRKSILVTPQGLRLPNGLYIYYPDLQIKNGRYVYKSRRGQIGIWGGAVVENIVQALARIVIGEQMIQIHKKYRPVLTVHDAVVCVAPKNEAQEALDFIMDEMKKEPKWAKGLPVTCEGGFADNYGDC